MNSKPLEKKDIKNKNFIRDNISMQAHRYIGCPYVWGGNSLTDGCDCSGFTHLLFKEYGISIPRVSSEQAKAGKEVKEPRPGDIICYYGDGGQINHVALYVGDNKVINASNIKDGIRKIDYRYRDIATIRDVIGD